MHSAVLWQATQLPARQTVPSLHCVVEVQGAHAPLWQTQPEPQLAGQSRQ